MNTPPPNAASYIKKLDEAYAVLLECLILAMAWEPSPEKKNAMRALHHCHRLIDDIRPPYNPEDLIELDTENPPG